MKLNITEPAKQDIEKIFADGYSLHGEKRATSYVESIYSKIQTLLDFPYLGHVRQDIPHTHRALKAEKEYIAIYRIDGDTIHIVRVLRGNRDFTQQEMH